MAKKSYAEIQKQIASLQREAEQLRSQEVVGVIARIKEAIAHYGLTAEQLGYGAASRTARAKAGKGGATRAAAYSDGLGNSWGGSGPRSQWLKVALSEGRTLEEFASRENSATAKPAEKPVKSTKRAAAKKRTGKMYRNENGSTWSGRGPRPRWLKEALEAGQTLEQLAVEEA